MAARFMSTGPTIRLIKQNDLLAGDVLDSTSTAGQTDLRQGMSIHTRCL